MSAPEMAGWNLALRFGLEITALVSFALAASALLSGPLRWLAVIIVPVAAAAIWGTFNVLDDPSRSGEAPVEVAGWIRLGIEVLVLGGGVIALALSGRPGLAVTFAVLVGLHYATSWSRIEWLIAS